MMLTSGVELSGYFDVLGVKWCAALPPSAGCPCLWCSPPRCCRRFWTNDVALFIIAPYAHAVSFARSWSARLIIFEALAVNGSLSGANRQPAKISASVGTVRSVVRRLRQRWPSGADDDAVADGGVLVCVPDKKLQYHSGNKSARSGKRAVWPGAVSRLYIVFLFALELKYELAGVLLVAAGFVVPARRVLVSVDWTLLLVFMAMFIDVHLLSSFRCFCRTFCTASARCLSRDCG